MDQQIANMLLLVANEFDKTARHFQATSCWFRSQYAPGLAALAHIEAKERWKYSCLICDHISDRGGVVLSLPVVGNTPATGQGWTASAVLSMLVQKDTGVLTVIKGTTEKLISQGEHSCAKFLMELEGDFWKDVNEVKQAADHAGEKVPVGLLVLDREYEGQYGRK